MGVLEDISEVDVFTIDRLTTLIDGIFAIAMTILILNISIPVLSGTVSENLIANNLWRISVHYIQFVISFIILAMLWISSHKQFSFVSKIDKTYLWINIFWLLFIVTVPFTTSLNGTYPGFILPNLIFNINMLIIGLIMFSSWIYLTKKGLIKENTSSLAIKAINISSLLLIFISIISIGLSFIFPHYSNFPYMIFLFKEFIIKKIIIIK
ncbi:MAG: TMEM175 family protein [Methanobacteriaceae archaeon]